MELSYVEQRHHGHIIARYREARHWSQQRLADELGVDLRTVQRMEQRPMIKSLRRRQFLIELLGIPAALLALESDKSRSDFVSLLLNEDPMAYLENALRLRLQTQQIGGPGSSSQGLSLWMSEVTHFVGIAQGS